MSVQQRVFITGASRGLGRALVREFHGRSALVTGTGRTPASGLDQTLACDYLPADLTSPGDLAGLLDQVEAKGLPDIVILNAGFAQEDDAKGLDTMAVRRQFEGNCLAPLDIVARFLPGMLERGRGVFVAVTSLAVYRENHAHRLAYSASKAALARTFENLRMANRPRGVHFLTVYPGRMNETAGGLLGTTYAAAALRIAQAALASPPPAVLRLPALQAALTMSLRLCPESWFRNICYR